MKDVVTPSKAANRIFSLDILRGFALLGILIMNMISFSMVGSNYINPHAQGELLGADKWAFIFSQLFANQKFMSTFSVLFGAGVVLFTGNILKKGLSEAKWHYKRNLYLLLIGLTHAYFIWAGDILVSYAMCSIWVFFFRNLKSKSLFIWSGIFFLLGPALNLFVGWSIPYWDAYDLAELSAGWSPSAESIASEIAAYTGGFSDQMPYRVKSAVAMETVIFMMTGWQITSMMLLGMALFKNKVLTGERSTSLYKRMAVVGLGLGLSIGVYGLIDNYEHDWSMEYSFFIGSQWNYFASLPMVIGYMGLVMLGVNSGAVGFLKKWFAPVGQAALTNYLMQSIIATFIFYGHGMGLFGTFGRADHWLVILPVWAFQILFSKWWLDRYKFGPFEWAWRSLTYGKFQELKK